MINMQKCQGIRYCHTKKDIIQESKAAESGADKSNSSSMLVCWFLTYPDGSLGMLYTMPVSSSGSISSSSSSGSISSSSLAILPLVLGQ